MAEPRDIAYTIEWEPAPGVQGDEHRATWARFEFWVAGECLTQVEDTVSGSARRSIYVSLYPLAEWIAFHWWPLFYNHRSTWILESARSRDLWHRQVWSELRGHRIREAGDGFLWPDLAILPEDGGQTFLMWQPDRAISESRMVRFISSGYKRVSSEELWLAFSSIIEQVINRMREQGVTKSPLTEEWERISAAEKDERDFCIAAARLGLDPYAEKTISLADGIIRAASTLAEDILTDFLDVARPDAIEEEIDWVLSSTDISVEHSVDLTNGLPRVAHIEDATTYRQYPWRTGWRSASLLRAELGLEPSDSARTEDWIKTVAQPLANKGMQALGYADGTKVGQLVLSRDLARRSRRFTEARAIWHLLDNPKGIFLVVASYGIRQKIERAFAAEFLAPAEGIRAIISDPSAVSWDEVERVADRFDVSSLVVRHQIENQLSGIVLD